MQKSITKRKGIGVESSSSGGTRSQDNTSEVRDGLERKRRKRSTSPNTDPADICAELYETIRNYRDDNGRILCESFIRAPKRRNSPEYYEVISSPIDLLKIQQRLKTDEYEDVETFSHDMCLLLENAIKFYQSDLQEHKDAVKLQEVFANAKAQLCGHLNEQGSLRMPLEDRMDDDEDDEKSEDDNAESDEEEQRMDKNTQSYLKRINAASNQFSSTADDEDSESMSTRDDEDGDSSSNVPLYCEELISAVLEMKDSHGRVICQLFKRLPPQSLYPEYYEIIKEPIDLKMMCNKLRNNQYTSLEEAERDLMLMVKNAHAFNEPGSQVYKDATAIKKAIHAKKAEIDHILIGAKSSRRLKARRSAGKMSTAVSALLDECAGYGEEESEMPEEEDYYPEDSIHDDEGIGGDHDSDNPLMMLFNDIQHFTDPTGRALSEPFLRLPSRRAYPDYYEVIKQPIALSKIRSQIKTGQYETLDELEKDLDLCFKNAQTYNEPNSMLYKDAQRMREHMKKKKVEIINYMEEKGISLEEYKRKKKAKKIDPDPSAKEKTSGSVLQRKPKTELRKPKKSKRVEEVDPLLLRKRMRQLYKAVVNYQDENGRYLSAIFVELPSSQDYPDYYQVISEPVCLSQIENNIRDNKYSGEDELMLDFEVMFDNARYYNEEDSQVYQDACTLEKVLRKKKKSLGQIHSADQNITRAEEEKVEKYQELAFEIRRIYGASKVTVIPGSISKGEVNPSTPVAIPAKQATPTKSGRISSSPGSTAKKYSQVPSATNELKELCRELFNAVKDCTDSHGRQLCLIFQKLPSRAEYPDYYTLIKKPIDMAKINTKLYGDQYQTLDDFLSDFQLMFDNACRYNEPDSQVYKDALSLARELLRKKAELVGEESKVPNMQDVVRKLLNALYQSIMNHVDEDGRCFSDSLAELSVRHDGGRPLSLLTIGEALRKGQYHRLDKFQEDMFAILEKAREVSRSDTEVYDDAVELQQKFVSQRDKLCKDGERFVSPALVIIKRHLLQELDEERKFKVEAEAKEDNTQVKEMSQVPVSDATCEQKMSYKGTQVQVGDFVYLTPREDILLPQIVLIEKLYTDNNGEQWLFGNWFYRPQETFHNATRKFLKKEVFKSDYSTSSKLCQVLGTCHVMYVKDYIKQTVEDFREEDLFVCESQYCIKRKSFRKIKVWSVHSSVTYIARPDPLQPIREPLKLSDEKRGTVIQAKEAEVEGTVHADMKRNVVLESPQNAEEGCTYYEQFCVRDAPYKLGDCVYVRSDEGYLCISRIDKMWTDQNGRTSFHGPWFISPADTQHLPTRMFYEKEVFLSSLEETISVGSISGKCCVLPFREYARCRPTEIPEKDIYLNEARYDEEEGQFRKLKGLKRYTLTVSVQEDEYYFFEKPITPGKAPSPLLIEDIDLLEEERSHSPAFSISDPGDGSKKTKKPRSQSGYLVFSHEMRASIRKEHPEYAFGEISRIIGVEWRNISAQKKADYEARAQMQPTQTDSEVVESSQIVPSGPVLVFECLWRGCDYQYEDLQELKIHLLDSTCHLRKSDDGFFHCLWTTCSRERRGMRPFNASSKLFRHCREVHLTGHPRSITQQQRSKNFFPKHRAALVVSTDPEVAPAQSNTGSSPNVQSVSPMLSVLSSGNQFASSGSHLQSSTVASQNSYPGGRLTPQALQQAFYQGNTGAGGMTPNNSAQTVVLQRQIYTPAQQPSAPGQVGGFVPQQQQQQQYSPAQPQQFNFQQQINQINTIQQQQQQQQQPPQQQQQQQQQVIEHASPPVLPMKETPAPIFLAPPPKPQRLHHSDAYLRYIEGLRDGSPHMSNWNQARKPDVQSLNAQQVAQLPVHWLGCGYGDYSNAVDALWALRDHMLRDALSLSREAEH